MELLRDRSEQFAEAGVHPYGISRDSAWTHIAWMQALDLNFPLLSDWNAEAVHGFGVTQDFRGLQDVAERSAFLVDHGGTGTTRCPTSTSCSRPRRLRSARLRALPRGRRRRHLAGGSPLRVELHGRRRARPRRGRAGRPPPDALPPLAAGPPGRARPRAVARSLQLPAGGAPLDQLRRLAVRGAVLAARRRS